MSPTPAAGRVPTRQLGRRGPRRGHPPREWVSWRRTIAAACAGGLAFWVVNLAISLTPIAAEYRSALSIAYVPMLAEALAGGMVLGLCVAYPLRRHFDRIPPKSPILKAVLLSGAILFAVTLFIEAPARLFSTPAPDVRHFLIGLLFNVLRILALGVAVGSVHTSADRGTTTATAAG